MHYIQLENDGNPTVQELDVDSYIAEIDGHFLASLYEDGVCAYSFDGCIAAGFAAHRILVNTPSLDEFNDSYKQSIQQAAIIHAMAERICEVDVLPSAIIRKYVDHIVDTRGTESLLYHLLTKDDFAPLRDTGLTFTDIVRDAVRIGPMLLQKPRLHVLSDYAWTITKYKVHMTGPVLRSEVAQNIYADLLPVWQACLLSGGSEFVHPVSAQILDQQKIIDDAVADIKKISELCKHPESEVVEVCKSASGNWSQSDDSESVDRTCKICGRSWYFNRYHGDKEFNLISTSQRRLPITP